jgi:hypothetical protein
MLAALALSVCGATRTTPLPEWFIAVLGIALPWIFATFINKLPSWTRAPVCYAIAAVIGIVAGFVWCGWRNLGDVLRNIVWLWATMQFVFDLFVRKVQKAMQDKATKNADAARLRRLP